MVKCPKYKMVLAYLGSGYAGWQVQPGQPTIQGELERAVRRITREEARVVGAGRTDSGVHALNQVAHFRLCRPAPAGLVKSLNAVLPAQIRVKRIRAVPDHFHARKDAWKKRYVYRIYDGPVLDPFLWGRVHHCWFPLAAPAMRTAAPRLEGRHDFSAFAAAGTNSPDRRRTLYLAEVLKRGHHWQLRFESNGFLYHMVRNMVGTLLEVGRGRRPWQDVERLLKSGDRQQAGPTAPAQGLYLVKVWYR